jgi:hypothetical protein
MWEHGHYVPGALLMAGDVGMDEVCALHSCCLESHRERQH